MYRIPDGDGSKADEKAPGITFKVYRSAGATYGSTASPATAAGAGTDGVYNSEPIVNFGPQQIDTLFQV